MRKVLIVDDNKELVKNLENRLNKCNEIQVVGVAYDGEEALSCIEKYLPDVVITDIEMPIKTGVEMIEIAKEFENAPEFIVVTGGASNDLIKRLYSLPIKNIFNKPIDFDRLIKEILITTQVNEEEIINNSRRELKKENKIISKIKNFLK